MTPGARRPGEHVVLREIYQGKTWALRPVIVVRDTPDVTALYIPHGVAWRGAVTMAGETLRVPWEPWRLSEPKKSYNDILRLSVPGEPYSVEAIWRKGWRMLSWYINVEEALRPASHGFDYMDWTLDVIVSPDMPYKLLKDEAELDEAVRRGVYPLDSPTAFREIADRAIERLTTRKRPFDEPWEDWRPASSWGTPVLPEL